MSPFLFAPSRGQGDQTGNDVLGPLYFIIPFDPIPLTYKQVNAKQSDGTTHPVFWGLWSGPCCAIAVALGYLCVRLQSPAR